MCHRDPQPPVGPAHDAAFLQSQSYNNMSMQSATDGPICAPAVQRVVIEDLKDSFNNIGATTEHAECLLGASAEYTLGSSYTHSIHNIRSEPEWDKFWNEKELPLIRRLVYGTHKLYL